MNHSEFSVFWKRIDMRARESGFPWRVMFELTYRCNFRCKHCYVPQSYKRRKELSTRDVLKVIDQLERAGCLYLGFTGGEPLMRKDIFEILRYAKAKGFQLLLNTNASLIDRRAAEELAGIGMNKVDITLSAAAPEVFDRVVGVSGAGSRVFAAIECLRSRHVAMGFKSCVLKENAAEIRRIRAFCRSLGCAHRLDDLLSPRLDGSARPYSFRGSVLGLPRRGGDCVPASGVVPEGTRGAEVLFPCGVGRSQAAITPSGRLKMCLMIDHPGYDILGQGFIRAWDALKRQVSRIVPDRHYQCSACAVRSYCSWCPARSWLYNRTFTSCDHQNKLQALRRQAQQPGRQPPTKPEPLPAGKK